MAETSDSFNQKISVHSIQYESIASPEVRQHVAPALLAFRAYFLDETVDLHFIAEERRPLGHAGAREAARDHGKILEELQAPVRGVDVRHGLRGWSESLLREALGGHNR